MKLEPNSLRFPRRASFADNRIIPVGFQLGGGIEGFFVSMSIHISSQAWKVKGISGTQKLVLVKLSDNANDNGVCWPSVATISRECCISDRAVQAALAALEKEGHLHRLDRHGNSRVYHIHPRTTFTPEGGSPPKEVHPYPRTTFTPPPNDVHPNRNRTINEPSITFRKSNTKEAESIRLPYESDAFASAWSQWGKHRREKRKNLTRSTIDKQLRKLASMGEQKAIATIENSIEQGYTGLFPPNEKTEKQNQRSIKSANEYPSEIISLPRL